MAEQRPPRAQVSVRIGNAPGEGFGTSSLLDFKVAKSLDGEPLTDEEWDTLMASAGGLVLIRGRWVEADPCCVLLPAAGLDDISDPRVIAEANRRLSEAINRSKLIEQANELAKERKEHDEARETTDEN